MTKLTSFLFCFLCLVSCNTDDDNGIDCSLFDPANPMLFIEMVDSDGNNLIENETFIADDIIILFNGYEFTNVVFDEVDGIENLVAFGLFGEEGDNTLELKLSDEVTDTLILNLMAENQVCGWTFMSLNSATYNGESQTIKDFNGGNYLITVVK